MYNNVALPGQNFASDSPMCSGSLILLLRKKCTLFTFDLQIMLSCRSKLIVDRPESLPFRDTFLPCYYGKHLRANMQLVTS
jgi:hypothetical protein